MHLLNFQGFMVFLNQIKSTIVLKLKIPKNEDAFLIFQCQVPIQEQRGPTIEYNSKSFFYCDDQQT